MSSTSHGIVCYTTLLLLLSYAEAQTSRPPPDQYEYANFTPSMAIIIVVLIAALFFMGFFSIYIRHCSESSPGNGSVRTINNLIGRSRRAANNRGLDSATIESFPIFAYSDLKDAKIGKGALECAVCLNEFEDDVTLRLLPKCDHVFHPMCIDAWLASHTTCPVCRADLEITAGDVIVAAPIESNGDDSQNSISVRVNDDDSIGVDDPVQQGAAPVVLDRSRSMNQNRPSRSRSLKSIFISKFPRSHSTGHSVILPGENVDRFTLRLPDDVRKEIMSRALNRTTSLLVLPTESSSRFGYRNYRRLESLDPVGKSDRWVFSMAPPFFTRAPSLKSSKRMENDGEGTSAMTPKGFITALKKSFGRLNSKGSERGLASADSVRPSI